MLLKTIDEKFTALVNAKLNSYEKVIGHDVLEIVKVVNDDDRRVKIVTVRDKREGMDQEPFDVEVDYFETEGRLLRDIYLPTGITAERVAEILHYDYFWDLTTEFVVEQLGKEPMVKGDKVIELKNTVKYYQDLNLHFVDSVSELPEELQAKPEIAKPYNFNPSNNTACNFMDAVMLWYKVFNKDLPDDVRIEAVVDVCVLSTQASGEYKPAAAQRVHWKTMNNLNVYVPNSFTNNSRTIQITANGNGLSAVISLVDQPTYLNWYDDWPQRFILGSIVSYRPAVLHIIGNSLEIGEDGYLKVKEGVDLSKLKDIDGRELITVNKVSPSTAFTNISEYVPVPGVPLVNVNLEDSFSIYSSWATNLFKRQLNWGSADFDVLQSISLAVSSSRTNTARTFAMLLDPFTRSPELVKVSGYGEVVEVFGVKRYKKYLRISVKGLPELEGNSWDIEISAPFTSYAVTVKESSFLSSEYHTAEKFENYWITEMVKASGTDVGGLFAFQERLYGIYGLANQVKHEYEPMIKEVSDRYQLPFNSTVFLHSADPKNFGKMTRKIDKDAKTATYTIEGTDSVLIITDADKHMLVEE